MKDDMHGLVEAFDRAAANLERTVAAAADAAASRPLSRDEQRAAFAALPRYARALAILTEVLAR